MIVLYHTFRYLSVVSVNVILLIIGDNYDALLYFLVEYRGKIPIRLQLKAIAIPAIMAIVRN